MKKNKEIKKEKKLTVMEDLLINLTFLTIGKIVLTFIIYFLSTIILSNYYPYLKVFYNVILLIFAYVLSSIIITPINSLLCKYLFLKIENNKIYLFLKQNNFKVIFAFVYIFLILKNIPDYCASSGSLLVCSIYFPPLFFPFNYLFSNSYLVISPKYYFGILLDILTHLIIGYLVACGIYKIYKILKK